MYRSQLSRRRRKVVVDFARFPPRAHSESGPVMESCVGVALSVLFCVHLMAVLLPYALPLSPITSTKQLRDSNVVWWNNTHTTFHGWSDFRMSAWQKARKT